MIRRYILMFAVFIFSAFFLCQIALAKEDTAQITLKKTAVSKKNVYTYIVKKGDILSAIARNIPGITEEDISDNYRLIQELNPGIDINQLKVGQALLLPGKPVTVSGEVAIKPLPASTAETAAATLPQIRTYAIKKGDTLFKIITSELKTDPKETLKIIKSMNPSIVDVNKIYAGDIIKLPLAGAFVKGLPAVKEDKLIEERLASEESAFQAKDKITMPPEARLAVIKHVISQMNGSFTSTGNYYLPIPKTGQVTIDCSKIPVIEFDDKSILFIDLENRAPDNLKKIISDNWTNYYLIKVDKKDDVIAILRKVFSTTKTFTMTKKDSPITVGSSLSAEFFADWIITRTNPQQASPLMQGLRLIFDNNSLLPKAVINYAKKNGVIITEISGETGLAGKPEEIYSLPAMPVYPTTSAKDFAYAFLSNLGFATEKDVDIKIFDTEKDGINLAIKADVVTKKDNKKYVIYSRELSQQFTTVLSQAGNEIIFVNNTDPPKIIMEKILRAVNIPFVSGNFMFSGLEKKQAPYSLNFNGTKIKTTKDLYVIDFAIDQEIRGLLQEVWAANIAKY
jgi:LysM repeat protein